MTLQEFKDYLFDNKTTDAADLSNETTATWRRDPNLLKGKWIKAWDTMYNKFKEITLEGAKEFVRSGWAVIDTPSSIVMMKTYFNNI